MESSLDGWSRDDAVLSYFQPPSLFRLSEKGQTICIHLYEKRIGVWLDCLLTAGNVLSSTSSIFRITKWSLFPEVVCEKSIFTKPFQSTHAGSLQRPLCRET